MRMFIRGEWVDRSKQIEVRHPYDGSLVDTVPQATVEDVDLAVQGAVEGAAAMRKLG